MKIRYALMALAAMATPALFALAPRQVKERRDAFSQQLRVGNIGGAAAILAALAKEGPAYVKQIAEMQILLNNAQAQVQQPAQQAAALAQQQAQAAPQAPAAPTQEQMIAAVEALDQIAQQQAQAAALAQQQAQAAAQQAQAAAQAAQAAQMAEAAAQAAQEAEFTAGAAGAAEDIQAKRAAEAAAAPVPATETPAAYRLPTEWPEPGRAPAPEAQATIDQQQEEQKLRTAISRQIAVMRRGTSSVQFDTREIAKFESILSSGIDKELNQNIRLEMLHVLQKQIADYAKSTAAAVRAQQQTAPAATQGQDVFDVFAQEDAAPILAKPAEQFGSPASLPFPEGLPTTAAPAAATTSTAGSGSTSATTRAGVSTVVGVGAASLTPEAAAEAERARVEQQLSTPPPSLTAPKPAEALTEQQQAAAAREQALLGEGL